jgi:hypothetical protein
MHTPNASCSYEQTGDRLGDLTTITSLKSSLASLFRSSFPQAKLRKTSSISVIKSEEYSTEFNEDDIDEDCVRKTVANFQQNYLALGQWPEVPVSKFQEFKTKYRNIKTKLRDCKKERDKAYDTIKKYERGKNRCVNCEVLKNKQAKTKTALEQAVQLSNLLLKEVKRLENISEEYE